MVTFDFSKEATSISSPVVATPTVDWSTTSDPTPGALISGAPAIVGTTVLQRIAATGVDYTDYYLKCTAISSTGDTLVVDGILPVRARIGT